MAADIIPIKKHRIWGIDIIRIICALNIYMGHSITMYGCSYGSEAINNYILTCRGPVMTMFFVLSGFSLYYSNYGRFSLEYSSTMKFYAKRAVQILPTYIALHFLYLFLGNDSFIRWLFMTPFEFTFLQSMYPNIFGVLHNGGTWFISCIMIAYMAFPVIFSVFIHLSEKAIYMITAVFMFMLVYIPFLSNYYSLGGNYSNPLFRILEFAFGMLCCACSINIGRFALSVKNKTVLNLASVLVAIVFTFLLLKSLASPVVIGSGKFVILLSALIEYPVFLIILCAFYICRSRVLEGNAVLHYCSGLIYYFFILQLILWNVTDLVFSFAESAGLNFIQKTNSGKLIVSFAICALLSVVMCEFIDKPVKNYCFKKLSIFADSSR